MIKFDKKRIDDFLFYLNQENMDVLELILREAIEEKIRNQWIVKENITYSGEQRICCAIGALGPNESNDVYCYFSDHFFRLISLDFSKDQRYNILNLMAGFDGSSNYGDKFYSLGRRLKEYAEELQGKN